MDIEKLIKGLKKTCWGASAHVVDDERRNAAAALSTLQAENEKLRAELENYRSGHCSEGGCAAEKDRDLVIAENKRLRSELKQVKRGLAVSHPTNKFGGLKKALTD